MIIKRSTKYILLTKDGTKELGRFDTKKAAEKREEQIRKAKYAKSN